MTLSAESPTYEVMCVVIVDAHWQEVEQISRLLAGLQINTGSLLTYRRIVDLINCPPPSGHVAMVVLASDDPPEVLTRALHWLRNRYLYSAMVVVGDDGCGERELAARIGGANYLTRPMHSGQWAGLLSHALSHALSRALSRTLSPPRALVDRREPTAL